MRPNLGHLTAASFVLIASAACAQGSPGYFVARPAVTTASGLSPGPAADLDLSGVPDVLLPHQGLDGFTLVLDPGVNDPPATLTFSFLPTGATGPQDLQVAEMNGDGVPDLVGRIGSTLYVFASTGPAAWSLDVTQAAVPAASAPGDLFLVDLDVDGLWDVVFWRQGVPFIGISPLITVYRNAWPTWQQTLSAPIDAQPLIGFGDFDGDSWPDMLSWERLNPIGASPIVLRTRYGDGSGAFPTVLDAFSPSSFTSIEAIGDADQDGRDDVLFVCDDPLLGAWIQIAWSSTTGFAAPQTVAPSQYDLGPIVTRILDVDRDGDPDILRAGLLSVAGSPANRIEVARGLGSRVFEQAPMIFESTVPYTPGPAVSCDLESDGDPDLVDFDSQSAPGQLTLRLIENRALRGTGCYGTGGSVPAIPIGNPKLGNLSFTIGLASALPSSSAALGLSLAPTPTAPCTILIDLQPGNLILPQGSAGLVSIDASGQAAIPAPLPSDPFWRGATIHAQWLVIDPGGGFALGPYSCALSPARRIVLW